MQNEKITGTQAGVWLMTALAGPLVFFSDGNWVGALLAGISCCLLSWCVVRFGKHWSGRVYACLQIIWLTLILSQLLSYSAACWPTGTRTFPLVPFSLLGLAVWSAQGNISRAARSACVLFWGVAFLYGIVIAAGIGDLKIADMKPSFPKTNWLLIQLLLLPALALFLPKDKCTPAPFAATALFAGAVSAWIAGSLSPRVATISVWPFYEAAKSVELFDTAKRFEALVCVAVTLGNYCLYSFFLSCVRKLGETFLRGKEAVYLCGITSAFLMLLGVEIKTEISVIISLLLWVLLPLLGLLKNNEKKVKNSENNA